MFTYMDKYFPVDIYLHMTRWFMFVYTEYLYDFASVGAHFCVHI